MNMFVVLALAAAAVAEPEAAADAQYVSTYGAFPLTTYNHVAAPVTTTYNHVAAPLTTTYNHVPLTTYNRAFTHFPTYSTSPLLRHFIAKREAEAEADPALLYNTYAPYTSTYAATAYPYSHVATPFVRTVASPVVKTVATPVVRTVAAPVVRTVAAPFVKSVVSPVVRTVASPVVASHTVTSYNNPEHYTAVSNGVYGPSYVAKNGPVQHVVKREAEADPALIYSSNVVSPLASTYAVASPLTTTYNHVAAPLTTYNHVATPLTTYNHVATPLTTYNSVVASPVTYAAHVATPLASNGAHAVAATTMGWTHSANVGVCTNVHGEQVAC